MPRSFLIKKIIGLKQESSQCVKGEQQTSLSHKGNTNEGTGENELIELQPVTAWPRSRQEANGGYGKQIREDTVSIDPVTKTTSPDVHNDDSNAFMNGISQDGGERSAFASKKRIRYDSVTNMSNEVTAWPRSRQKANGGYGKQIREDTVSIDPVTKTTSPDVQNDDSNAFMNSISQDGGERSAYASKKRIRYDSATNMSNEVTAWPRSRQEANGGYGKQIREDTVSFNPVTKTTSPDVHNDDSNAFMNSINQDGGERNAYAFKKRIRYDSATNMSNEVGTDENVDWKNKSVNRKSVGLINSRTRNVQDKESDTLFENIETRNRKSPHTDDEQIWQRLELNDSAYSHSKWKNECPDEEIFHNPNPRSNALNDSKLGMQTLKEEFCHNSDARNNYIDDSKKRKLTLELEDELRHSFDPRNIAFSDSKKRKFTVELEHELCRGPDSRGNGSVDGGGKSYPSNSQSPPNYERELQADPRLRYLEEAFNSDNLNTNDKSPFHELERRPSSIEAETTNERSPKKPRMLDLQALHWPKSPLTQNSRSLLHFPDDRAYDTSNHSRYRRSPDHHLISHSRYLSDKTQDRFDTYHSFTMSKDESVWHPRYPSSPGRGPTSRGRFLSDVGPDRSNSDSESNGVTKNLKSDVQDTINRNRYLSGELSGRLNSVSPLNDTESERHSSSRYARHPYEDLTSWSRYPPDFMPDQLRPELHFPNGPDRGIPIIHRPKLTPSHSPGRVRSPSSPVSPFSPSTPVPMCLPYPHSPCSSFQYPCRSCSLPGPFYQRPPYNFPPPFLPLPAGIPHFPQSLGPIPDKHSLSKQNVDSLSPKKSAVDQKHSEASVSESPLPPLAVHIPKTVEIKRTRKEQKMRTIKQPKKSEVRDAAKESNGKSLSQTDSSKCLETLGEDKVSAENDSMNVEYEENEKVIRISKGRKFTCKFCGKVYISLGALKMHIRTHTLPCKCNICGKAFSRPWLLQGHIRTHTGEKPYKCHMCQRAFADRSNLRAHLQTHSDVKKYSCRICHKTFSRMSLLVKHEEAGCLVS